MLKFSPWTALSIAAAYILANEAAVHLLRIAGATPLLWLASGVALAALILRGVDAMPGVWLGAFVCVAMSGHSIALALVLSTLITLQIAIAWALLSYASQLNHALERIRDVLLLIAIGATFIPLTSALASIANVYVQPELATEERQVLIQVATLGEALGIVLLVPPILSWARHFRTGSAIPGKETWLLFGVTTAVSVIVFSGQLAPAMNAGSLPYALFPVTFWAALRLGLRDTATALLLCAAIAVGYHSQGLGPFVMPSDSPSQTLGQFASLYLFLAVLSATSLLAAAAQVERTVAEAQVRASEERYRTLIERMNEGVNITDAEARMVFVSDRFCEMSGYSRTELIGQTGEFLAIPEMRSAWRASHQVRRAGKSQSHALTLKRKDGQLLHVWISPSPQFDEANQYLGSLNVVLDITDRRRAEDRARKHLDQLAHVARVASMGEMASAIAHEINQPLTAIANYANASLRLLKSGKLSSEEIYDTMQRLATEAERAGAVVRKMRGFVRAEETHPARLEIDELFADVLRLTSAEARQYDVEVSATSTPGLPPVLVDAVQIQQVLLNLVRNALEALVAIPVKERRVTLSAQLNSAQMIEIEVRDSGPGLTAAAVDKIFEPFYTTKAEGLGIGLALSRSIVDAHGGRLWAVPNQPGAVFRLTLPVAESACDAAAACLYR